MDTKKLRQKILDLAIHGKLVPQDPNDEPASVLLERIRAEKEKLIKEGKIKKSRKTSSSSDTPHYENVPFDVPQGWAWSRLGEMFTLQAGKNITAKAIYAKQDTDHCYPCYGGNGLRGYVGSYNREGRFPLIGRQGALCGNINEANGRFYATEHAVIVNTYCDTNIDWAINVLVYLNLNQYATSTAQPGLSVGTINEVVIPIPPLEEQQRISQKLNDWFCLIDQIEQGKSDLQTTIKQIKNKILDLAIHGRLVPQNPEDEPASELLKRINPKAKITCDNAQYGNLPNGWLIVDFNSIFETISSKPYQIKQSQIKSHGIRPVVSQSMNHIEGYTDEANYLHLQSPVLVFGDHTRIVKYIDFDFVVGADGVKIINPFFYQRYAYYMILYASINIEDKGYSRHFCQIAKFTYCLPPLKEQIRIVAKIEELSAQLDKIESSLQA